MPGIYDDTGGYVDPQTGMWVAAPQQPQPGQANASWNPLRGIGNALFPAAVAPNPPSAFAPPAPPQASPAAPLQSPQQAPAMTPPVAATPDASAAPQANPQAPQQDPAKAGLPSEETPIQRYNRLASTVVPGESGGNPNAKNPNSSASGTYQLTDGTFNDFLASPANTGAYTQKDRLLPAAQQAAVNWNFANNDQNVSKALGRPATDDELLASHLLGGAGVAALAANPTANAYSTYSKIPGVDAGSAWQNNGKILNKDQTGQDAIASAASYYRTGAGGGRTQVAGPGAPTGDSPAAATTPPASQPTANLAQAQSAMGGYSPQPLPYPNAASLPAGSGMLALAGGLLSGPNFSQGLGKGINSMLSVDQANRQGQMQTNQMAMQQNQQQMELSKLGIMYGQGQQRLLQGQQRVDNQGRAIDNRSDVGLQGSLAASRGLATGAVKDNLKDSETMAADYKSSGDLMQTIADARQEIQKNPNLIGSAVTSRVNRYMTQQLGIPLNGMDPSDAAITEKIVNGLNNSSVISQSKGTISRLTQGEFNAIKGGYLSMNSSPQAALSMLDTMEQEAKRRMSIGEDWANTSPTDKASVLKDPNGFDTWYMGKLGGQYVSRGINSDPMQPTKSQYQTAPNGGVQHAPIDSFWK